MEEVENIRLYVITETQNTLTETADLYYNYLQVQMERLSFISGSSANEEEEDEEEEEGEEEEEVINLYHKFIS